MSTPARPESVVDGWDDPSLWAEPVLPPSNSRVLQVLKHPAVIAVLLVVALAALAMFASAFTGGGACGGESCLGA